jgi:hypothetical protein
MKASAALPQPMEPDDASQNANIKVKSQRALAHASAILTWSDMRFAF